MRLLKSYCLRGSKFLSLNLQTRCLAHAHTRAHTPTVHSVSQPIPCWMSTAPGLEGTLGMGGGQLLYFLSASWVWEVKTTLRWQDGDVQGVQRLAPPTHLPSLQQNTTKLSPLQSPRSIPRVIGMCNDSVSWRVYFSERRRLVLLSGRPWRGGGGDAVSECGPSGAWIPWIPWNLPSSRFTLSPDAGAAC